MAVLDITQVSGLELGVEAAPLLSVVRLRIVQ